MKSRNYCVAFLILLFVLASAPSSVFAQSVDERLAKVSGGGSTVRFDIAVSYSAATITISTPDEQVIRRDIKSGGSSDVVLTDAKGERYPDGIYTYEIRITPEFASGVKEALAGARKKGNEDEVLRDMRKKGILFAQPTVQSGSFSVVNGSIVLPGAIEDSRSPQQAVNSVEPQPRTIRLTPAGQEKIRRHHTLLMAPFDFVIADDLIVQGSACVGIDCINGEDFGFDTIRVKENNTRIQFDDTSTTAGFPTNNWQIRANSSASGGQSFLGFVDQGATGTSETGTIVFEVDAGAPANSLRVASTGRVGLRTATPVLDVHTNTSNTPAMRLEQNSSGGFTAQTWDIAGNEANFFIRDVTAGSRLPFRIRPGAPTSSLDVAANGNVGVGTAAPNSRLDIKQIDDSFVGSLHLRRSTTNDTWAVATGNDNNLYFGYATSASLANEAADFTVIPLVVTATNRVGIGTTAPDQRLSVNGDASKVGGGSWLAFSDERLKNIRGPFNSGLKAVMQLQPLRYQYRPDNALGLTSNGEYIGFGAQAVQKVIPEAVTANSDGYLMVNNDPIIWTMLNAIKEQQQEIEKLKQEVRQLRAKTRKRR